MGYTKTTWVNDSEPSINADNLNKMEQGIFDAQFPDGGTNGQYLKKGTSGVEWGDVTDPVWGNITGTLSNQTDLSDALAGKVDKDGNKVLSDENFTLSEKQKLAGIASGAEVNVQANWNETSSASDAFIQNKPTNVSDFTNDTGFITGVSWGEVSGTISDQTDLQTALSSKQDNLTFDSAPTTGSTNPVTSDGIKSALDGKEDTLTFDSAPTENSGNPVTSGGLYDMLSPAATEATGQSILTTETALSTTIVTLLTRLVDSHPTEEVGNLIVGDLVQENILLEQLARNIEESEVF